jgi:hypothetical protein
VWCITTSGFSSSNAGGAWSTYVSAPPGTAAGSPLNCFLTGVDTYCITTSGVYYSNAGGAWDYYTSAPP